MFNRQLTIIQNNRGLSLIEIMIAGALLSIIGVGVGTIINNTSRSQRGLQAKDQQREVVAEIRTMLNSKVACQNTFGGLDPVAGANAIGNAIRDAANVARYSVGGNHSSNLLRYSGFTVSDYVADPAPAVNQGKAVLTVRLDKIGDTLGVRQLVERINMQVKLNGAGRIVECFTFGSLSDGIWQISPFNSSNIYYSAGNVGVATDNPDTTLQVSGSVRARFGPTNGYTFTDNPGGGGGDTAFLRYLSTTGTEQTQLVLQNGNDPRGGNQDDIRIRAQGGIMFDTSTVAGAYTQRMRIDSNGNVGIGTDTPNELLVVGDDVGDITTNKALVIGDTPGNAQLIMGRDANNLFSMRWDVGGYAELSTRRAATTYPNTLVMRDGNVGINTNAPTEKLHIEGNVFVNGSVESLAYHWTSDTKLKNVIKKSEGLSAITKLNGYHFSWKNTGQKVEKVFPELVQDNQGYKSVNYMGLVAPLIESVKDLKERQAKLKKKIAELEAKLAKKRNKK
jgi:hypothetical protein